MAKEYPSIWITEQIEPDVNGKPIVVWDISVKLKADLEPVHYNKPTLEEAKIFCIDRYGKYDSIKRAI